MVTGDKTKSWICDCDFFYPHERNIKHSGLCRRVQHLNILILLTGSQVFLLLKSLQVQGQPCGLTVNTRLEGPYPTMDSYRIAAFKKRPYQVSRAVPHGNNLKSKAANSGMTLGLCDRPAGPGLPFLLLLPSFLPSL